MGWSQENVAWVIKNSASTIFPEQTTRNHFAFQALGLFCFVVSVTSMTSLISFLGSSWDWPLEWLLSPLSWRLALQEEISKFQPTVKAPSSWVPFLVGNAQSWVLPSALWWGYSPQWPSWAYCVKLHCPLRSRLCLSSDVIEKPQPSLLCPLTLWSCDIG